MLNKAKKAEKRELQRLAEQAEQERLAEEARLRAERIDRLTLERDAEIAKHEAEEFARLRLLVENGWEIVSVVPRTYGGFSSHKTAKSHAHGTLNTGADAQEVHLGGHVVGVYVLLKYAINAQNFVASEALVRSTISDLLPERLRAPIV